MRSIREQRARIQERLSQTDSPAETGYEVLSTVLQLLSDPAALYQAAHRPARKIINKAIFGKLYVQADERGPYIASDELNEPFETVLYARRASGLSEAQEQAEARLEEAGQQGPQALGDLLVAALGSKCSSTNRMVEVAGIEPASFSTSPGLLRAQSAVIFSAPAVTQTSRRRAQSLFDVPPSPATGLGG